MLINRGNGEFILSPSDRVGQLLLSPNLDRPVRDDDEASDPELVDGAHTHSLEVNAMTLPPRKIPGSGVNVIPIAPRQFPKQSPTIPYPALIDITPPPRIPTPRKKDTSDWKLNPAVFAKLYA